ncbi:MAG: uracil-DNA glycosylase [Nanoarchaeota archaeon]|nr:uracil-DNA glycosylase [Nanoarchaeota archaeon]
MTKTNNLEEKNLEKLQIEKKQKKLNSIKKQIIKELKCPLKDAANNIVFGKGNPNAQILFIGEAPGEKEDLQGIPFVGKAGKQLDKLLNQINLTLDDIYIANILKYRPPKNRDPTLEEIKNHAPYLIKQIKTIEPKIIATLGNYSTKFVLSNFKPEKMKKIPGIKELHGKKTKIKLGKNKFTVVPIYHPSAIVYRPSLKEDFENDFKIMAKIIGNKFNKPEEQKSLKEIL